MRLLLFCSGGWRAAGRAEWRRHFATGRRYVSAETSLKPALADEGHNDPYLRDWWHTSGGTGVLNVGVASVRGSSSGDISSLRPKPGLQKGWRSRTANGNTAADEIEAVHATADSLLLAGVVSSSDRTESDYACSVCKIGIICQLNGYRKDYPGRLMGCSGSAVLAIPAFRAFPALDNCAGFLDPELYRVRHEVQGVYDSSPMASRRGPADHRDVENGVAQTAFVSVS